MTLHLIAHVVRGEPSFDIAILAEDMGTDTDPGPWWIMPSTGHRCYPYWHILLTDLGVDQAPDGCWAYGWDETGSCKGLIPIPADDHPDFCHYTLAPASNPAAGLELLSKLGLIKPKEPLKRRI